MTNLFEPLHFKHGPAMKNRFAVAPLTSIQSDAVLSEDEHKFHVKRAEGGFGLTITGQATVTAFDRIMPLQPSLAGDEYIQRMSELVADMRKHDCPIWAQIGHGGRKCPAEFNHGQTPVAPSANEETGAREMTVAEIEEMVETYVQAAKRAELAGFHGVQLHGAHGMLIGQFLSKEVNLRKDDFGGSLENRSRFLKEVIAGIRQRCSADLQLGLRLAAEGEYRGPGNPFGTDWDTRDARNLAQSLFDDGQLDSLDLSLWEAQKEPEDENLQGRTLMSYFTELDRGETRLGAAGQIYSARQAQWCLDQGCDFVLLGRPSLVHHDFPRLAEANPDFVMEALPVSEEHYRAEGLSETFINYLKQPLWQGMMVKTT